MARTDDLHALPADIAVPHDDGACAHLAGRRLPSLLLASTDGGPVDLARIAGRVVVYAYPRTGRPDQPPLVEDWNQIPGARGCTPQSCAFRDHHAELKRLGAAVFGLSTQDTHYQREMVERLHLPFPVLSDARLELANALQLPTFTVAHTILIKRLTFIARDGAIEQVFYPVFPPNRNAADVVAWLNG
jgi:peroxiredoxin